MSHRPTLESQSPITDILKHMEREGESEKEGMQGREEKKQKTKKQKTMVDVSHRPIYLGGDRIQKTNEEVIPLEDSFL